MGQNLTWLLLKELLGSIFKEKMLETVELVHYSGVNAQVFVGMTYRAFLFQVAKQNVMPICATAFDRLAHLIYHV